MTKIWLSKMMILYLGIFIIAFVQAEVVESDDDDDDDDDPNVTEYMQEVTEYLTRLEHKLDNIDDKLDAEFEPSTMSDMEAFNTLKGLGHEWMDLVFVLDSSTSLMTENFRMLKSFMARLVLNGNVDSGATQVGLCLFSTNSHIIWNLNQYNTTHDILDAIDDVTHLYGSTNIAKALRKVRTEMFTAEGGNRPEAAKVIVFVTDGISNFESNSTIPEASYAKEEGIHIFTVGVGLPNNDEIVAISSSPTDSYNIESFDALFDIVPNVSSRLYFDNFEMPEVSFRGILYSNSKDVAINNPTLPYVIQANGEGFDPESAMFAATDAGLYGFSLRVCSKGKDHVSYSLASGDVMIAQVVVQETDEKTTCSWADAMVFLEEGHQVRLEYSGHVSESEENLVYVSFSGVYFSE